MGVPARLHRGGDGVVFRQLNRHEPLTGRGHRTTPRPLGSTDAMFGSQCAAGQRRSRPSSASPESSGNKTATQFPARAGQRAAPAPRVITWQFGRLQMRTCGSCRSACVRARAWPRLPGPARLRHPPRIPVGIISGGPTARPIRRASDNVADDAGGGRHPRKQAPRHPRKERQAGVRWARIRGHAHGRSPARARASRPREARGTRQPCLGAWGGARARARASRHPRSA